MNLERTHDVLVKVAEFLRKLPDDQVDALLSGEARLELIPKGHRVAAPAGAKKPAALDISAEQVNADLKALNDRAAATKYLKDLKLAKAPLAELAKQLDVACASKDTAAIIMERIVEQKVGRRLSSDAIFARKQ
ncbi:hypothetical protein Rhe02_12320 [Rhizocola hellebori]|uniref:Uncharacterized protein n=1 Tax=Rhizocola hellebori TaxID=1392758 RepID=A0A8J3Q3G5_9ACTN|nr:hypothetical protein [Rhizocola hellebori]GIH03165.1 hypothetical protein Rhe02_12320 [Rhizocola hellebori]